MPKEISKSVRRETASSVAAVCSCLMAFALLSGCSDDGADGTGAASEASSVISSQSVSSAGSSEVSAAQSSALFGLSSVSASSEAAVFTLPDTAQQGCYDDDGVQIACAGSGQDGAYTQHAPAYTVQDGVVTDHVTGLMWQRDPDVTGDGVIGLDDKMRPEEAMSYCDALTLGGYDDWRLPEIKTLYSLMDFSGEDVSGYAGSDSASLSPFIDTDYFGFAYGDSDAGERIIDSQWATATDYVSTVFEGASAMFGVNFADGRIKGYPKAGAYYVRCVRGSDAYGENRFKANGDGTVTDLAAGLMWEQNDSQEALGWQAAIDYCESGMTGGYADWRLPNAKTLQSIVDYSRAPDTTGSAAIDTEVFGATAIVNEAGAADYGFYWSSTTHVAYSGVGTAAVYVSFGRALGYMDGTWMDVHGAGAQRSDPKTAGTLDAAYTTVEAYDGTAIAHGPQGDAVRLENFARCVRTASE